MPHATLKLIPGVDQNRTIALNEAAISTTNLVRFVPDRQGIGLPQKLGGWTKFYPAAADTKIRALWAWEDINANSHLGVGCETIQSTVTSSTGTGSTATLTFNSDYVYSVGSSITITGMSPSGYNGTHVVTASSSGSVSFASTETGALSVAGTIISEESLFVITDNSITILTPREEISDVPVSASTTVGSSIVTINAAGSNLLTGDTVYILTPISVGGLILFGTYEVSFVSASSFSIIARNSIGAPVKATSTVINGGSVPVFSFTQNKSSIDVNLPNNGYSVGDTFTVLVEVDAGDITIYGNYIVTTVVDADNFTITTANIAQSQVMYVTPTAVSSTGSYATITHVTAYTFAAGNKITVSGYGAPYNGTYTVTSATSTTVTFASANNWNALTASNGTIYNATGGNGSSVTLHFAGNYVFNANDKVVVTNLSPAGYNGTFLVASATANTVTYNTATTGDITITPATSAVFNSYAPMNSGEARYEYYRIPGPTPTSTGYGVGGYGAGGYGVGSPGSGAVTTGSPIYAADWTLDNWGQVFLACPVGGQIFQWDPTAGISVSSLIPNTPTVNDGMFVAMPQRQIVAWGSTFTGIQDPLLIRWCDVNDYTSWIASITNQAGSYRIPKGSRIICGIQGPQQGLIWTDLGLWAMQYVGPPYVYQFNEIGAGCGLIARKAATAMNGVIYWMGQSQFYRLAGSGVEVIPCPIWDVIFQDLDQNNLEKIRIAANSQFGEISWFYPTQSNGGEVNAYVKYNVMLNQWDFGTLSRTAWINQSVLGPPIGAGENKYIYQHETSTDADGLAMNSSFQTGYFSMTEGEWKVFVDQVWPDFKWGYYGGSQNATLLLTFYVTDYPTDDPVAYGPFTLTEAVQFVTPRLRGRLMSIKIESNDVGSFWRLGALRYRVQQDGKF